MIRRVHGIIKGRQIELDRDMGLPPGSEVEVQIELERPSLDEQRRLMSSLYGSCGDDPSFAAAVSEIERQRRANSPRAVEFDVAS
jgi:hypothetical protein